ncbi:hypothetical protein BDV98DRAFT_568219 [Pterulicium gracile]|uniref:Uncharacterized protein n=1 Tax=Pterulicium gracile TaxID=1884261 RepID=A0A5C3QFX1_9AGAR|nr:hypothetical protein BDV98DRAFT_568219 [Pterula gracilis]
MTRSERCWDLAALAREEADWETDDEGGGMTRSAGCWDLATLAREDESEGEGEEMTRSVRCWDLTVLAQQRRRSKTNAEGWRDRRGVGISLQWLKKRRKPKTKPEQ